MNFNVNPDDYVDTIHQYTQQVVKKLINNATINITPATKKGDNYISVIFRIHVSDKNGTFDKTFISKSAIIDPTYRMNMSTVSYFNAEVNFYENVFPSFLEFQKSRNAIGFTHVPECYLTSLEETKEVIFLEDFKSSGYELWDRQKDMPEDYIRKILQLYGRYHALSFAVRDQEPEKFQKLVDGSVDVIRTSFQNFPPEMKQGLGMMIQIYMGMLREITPDGVFEKFRKLAEFEKLSEVWLTPVGEEVKSVLSHGDCWCNNYLFKKTPNDLEVRFLDFQQQRLESPAFDFLYFFLVQASGDVLRNFDEYVLIYYSSFNEFLRELGSNPDELFTLEDFYAHLKKYGEMGVIRAALAMRLLFAVSEDLPDSMEELMKNVEKGKGMEKIVKRIRDVLVVADEKGLF